MNQTDKDRIFREINDDLLALYGMEEGLKRYEYLLEAANNFLKGKKWEQLKADENFDMEKPYDNLAGTIFAIAYPDNIYEDHEYTLKTLYETLKEYFPSIKGVHILPERTMSHHDVWPQDLFKSFSVENSIKIIRTMQMQGILDENKNLNSEYSEKIESFYQNDFKKLVGNSYGEKKLDLQIILDNAYNSHFNDGGFSQKTRAEIDPRFGLNEDLEIITKDYSVMLDFVVNHLDIDNIYLEDFRKGNNSGDAFLIIYRDQYMKLKRDRILEKTFRPRPFPLFTGLRKYPISSLDGEPLCLSACSDEMNLLFIANELEPLDLRIVRFLSIFHKIENDQGLSSEDRRIFKGFEEYGKEVSLDTDKFWHKSIIQANQYIFNRNVVSSMDTFIKALDLQALYGELFEKHSDHIFGKEFYIYTTFSESQADINPLSLDGFKMIVDDLFHLLSSGALTMMRMDAIKYLWKEIGKKNFDMDEGNRLIKVIGSLMKVCSPSTLALDEINSPDPIVYSMSKGGGFAYLFGQVNVVPIAFNEGSLEPIRRFQNTMTEQSPRNLLKFVMLSTHDGRSVQGLGVQRGDGHVSVEQFYNLKDTVEARGGRAKYRTVPKGEVPGDLLRKILSEAGFAQKMATLKDLFEPEQIESSDLYRLKDQNMDVSDLFEELSSRLSVSEEILNGSAPIDYFIQWIIKGRTEYELCCTSRSAFTSTDHQGNTLTEEEEASRLVLAQLYVLTQGQDVPAIYFNDLLGLENDRELFDISGKARDLNRHKNSLKEVIRKLQVDPFTNFYANKLNEILKLRSEDKSFYPGSESFQFHALGNHVFVNHCWHNQEHCIVLGNIVNQQKTVKLESSLLESFKEKTLSDQITGKDFPCSNGDYHIDLDPFGYVWLK